MVEAGTTGKGDVKVTIEPSETRSIEIKSKLVRIYGEAIRRTVEEMTKDVNAKIIVEDKGALDWVIRARVESALRKFRGERE